MVKINLSRLYHLWKITVFFITGSKFEKQKTSPWEMEKTTAGFLGWKFSMASQITAWAKAIWGDSEFADPALAEKHSRIIKKDRADFL